MTKILLHFALARTIFSKLNYKENWKRKSLKVRSFIFIGLFARIKKCCKEERDFWWSSTLRYYCCTKEGKNYETSAPHSSFSGFCTGKILLSCHKISFLYCSGLPPPQLIVHSTILYYYSLLRDNINHEAFELVTTLKLESHHNFHFCEMAPAVNLMNWKEATHCVESSS